MQMQLIRLRPIWFSITALFVGVSIAFLAMWGLKQGIEFTGGSLLVVHYPTERPSVVTARQVIDDAKLDIGSVVIQPVGETDMQFRLSGLTEDQHQALLTALRRQTPELTELRFDAIGPTIGNELRQKSLRGLLIVLIAILAYVAYAFRKVSSSVQSWKYGVVTIAASSVVVLVPLGLYAFLGKYHGVEIGTPFVAALMTIIGYSITDTIVVMDRIRENLKKMSTSFAEVVEASIRQTFVRSITNSMATLLTLVAIFVYGGDTLDEFTLPLIVGIVVGTYASMLFAAPLLVAWQEWGKRNNR